MAKIETLSTEQAAKVLGVTVATFRKKAHAANLTIHGTVETGKRGRPAFLFSKAQVLKLKK